MEEGGESSSKATSDAEASPSSSGSASSPAACERDAGHAAHGVEEDPLLQALPEPELHRRGGLRYDAPPPGPLQQGPPFTVPHSDTPLLLLPPMPGVSPMPGASALGAVPNQGGAASSRAAEAPLLRGTSPPREVAATAANQGAAESLAAELLDAQGLFAASSPKEPW